MKHAPAIELYDDRVLAEVACIVLDLGRHGLPRFPQPADVDANGHSSGTRRSAKVDGRRLTQ